MESPAASNAALLLADGTVFFGNGIGQEGLALGEICFNTAMTGYQEVLTDPSYTGQIITFTFPHIGNVGCNQEDVESGPLPHTAAGIVLREPISTPSNFRSIQPFNDWLIAHGITGIAGVDTRALTRHIRQKGATNAVVVYRGKGRGTTKEALAEAKTLLTQVPDMSGLELAQSVTTQKPYGWNQPLWSLDTRHPPLTTSRFHVVAIDFGEKQNISRCLTSAGCRVTIVPAESSFDAIMGLKPDGVFLSNGPGDPAATGEYAVPVIKKLIAANVPVFGICLGHQILGLALGGKTEKMAQGHRGANHPVKNLQTGKVEITSQNHGFVVREDSLPGNVEITHRSLFDKSVEGLRVKDKPVFSVQYHPESTPGPHQSRYLFEQFITLMENA